MQKLIKINIILGVINMSTDLMKLKNWVVVGDVANPSKYAFKILHALKSHGYNVEGVNPRTKDESIHKDLKSVSYQIDVIDLCINPVEGLKIVEEAKAIGINKILIQPGAGSVEILNFCSKNGIIAIEGCALVELSRL